MRRPLCLASTRFAINSIHDVRHREACYGCLRWNMPSNVTDRGLQDARSLPALQKTTAKLPAWNAELSQLERRLTAKEKVRASCDVQRLWTSCRMSPVCFAAESCCVLPRLLRGKALILEPLRSASAKLAFHRHYPDLIVSTPPGEVRG